MGVAEHKAHEVGERFRLVALRGHACGYDIDPNVTLSRNVIRAVWKSIVRDNPELRGHEATFISAARGEA
jgi:hypothetical protein